MKNCTLINTTLAFEYSKVDADIKGKIDSVLNPKLDALSKTEADSKAKAEEIAVKEKNLKWLESIQNQVNNIIHF